MVLPYRANEFCSIGAKYLTALSQDIAPLRSRKQDVAWLSQIILSSLRIRIMRTNAHIKAILYSLYRKVSGL
jgi:hypothetical protein